jgi:hypothetical protein
MQRHCEVSTEDGVCFLEQTFAGKHVAALGYPTVPADLTGFVSPLCQSKVSSGTRRAFEPINVVKRGHDRHGGDGTDIWRRHQQPHGRMLFGDGADLAVQVSDACEDVAPGLDQRFEDWNQFGRDSEITLDDLIRPALEPADTLAKHDAESLQQAYDLVLKTDAHTQQRISRRQQRPIDISLVAFDLHGFEPTGSHDLREAAGIMFNTPLACRASRQMIGRFLAASAFHSQTAKGPVSMPTFSSSPAQIDNQSAIASGQVVTLVSARILPS